MRIRNLIVGTALAIVMATGPAMAAGTAMPLPGYCPKLQALIQYIETHYDLTNAFVQAILAQLNAIYANNCVQ